MIKVSECRELVKISGKTLHQFSVETGKGSKNIAVSMCNAKFGMLGEKISRQIATTHNKECDKFFGKSMAQAMRDEDFMNISEFGEFLCLVNRLVSEIGAELGKSKKFFYVTLINQKAISLKLCAQLWREWPQEIAFVLGQHKHSIIKRYLGGY